MKFHWQDLNDDRRRWLYGRAWLRRDCEWNARWSSLNVEWAMPCSHCGWSVTLGAGDSGRNLQIAFAVPFLFTLYVTIENVFGLYAFGTDFDRGSDRQIGCYFYEGAFWWNLWIGTMASWSRDYAWCRRWRHGSVDFADVFLGKSAYKHDAIGEPVSVSIPMPEGSYRGTAQVYRQAWKRPRWFRRERVSTEVTADKCVPHAGKGENSWDCGDDGLVSCSHDGADVDAAVGYFVGVVLRNRRRYGMPSDRAIREALA